MKLTKNLGNAVVGHLRTVWPAYATAQVLADARNGRLLQVW